MNLSNFCFTSPDSNIVLAAFHATKLMKLVIQKVAENHHRDEDTKRKAEAEQIVNADLAAKGELMQIYSKSTSIPPSQVEEFGHFYNGPLQRGWLDNSEKGKTWLPQSGDMIIYNRVHHGIFINGHLNILNSRQRTLPSILPPSTKTVKTVPVHSLENGHTDSSSRFQYFIGTVVWVRVVFPSSELAESCSDASPLFAIGIRFHYKWLSKSIQVVYWKPCLCDDGAEPTDTCKSCGLPINQSFLAPAWAGPLDKVLPPFPLSLISSSSTLPIGIPNEYAKRVYTCLEHLKGRLVRGTPIDKFQPHGYFLDDCLNDFSDIPNKFQHIFEEDDNDSVGHDSNDSSLNMAVILSRKSYVEPWAFAAVGTKTSKISTRAVKSSIEQFAESSVPFHETCIPNPNLSLNAIQQRVINGFYRGRDVIVNDIREACVACVTYILKDRLRTKRLSSSSEFSVLQAAIQSCGIETNDILERNLQDVSMKEKHLLASTSEPTISEIKSLPEPRGAFSIQNLSHQERTALAEIEKIFMLHAIALVIVLETASAEIALGVEPPRFDDHRGTLRFEQELARKNLNLMLTAIGPDKMKFRKPIPAGGELPNVKVQIKVRNTEEASEINSKNNNDLSKPMILQRETYECNLRLKKALGFVRSGPVSAIKVFVKCKGMQMTTGSQIVLDPRDYEKHLGSSDVFDCFKKDGCPPHIKVVLVSDNIDFTEIGSQVEFNTGSNVGERNAADESKPQKVEEIVEIERQSDADEDESITNNCLTFFPADYLNNLALIRTLFCRSKRRQICVKCVMGKKGLFTCRVRCAHSNHDPTWIEYYRSQGGIDAILTILDPGHKAPPQLYLSRDVADDEDDVVSECGSESKSQAQTEASTNEEDIVASLEVASATQIEAESAMSVAHALLERAEKEIQSPLVLSTEFMHENFDVDPEDGHFEICPKCGLGGDVICCESCPMVSHPKCEEMSVIPDEEWHCYYCVNKMNRGETKPIQAKSVKSKGTSRNRSQTEEKSRNEESNVDSDFHSTVEKLTNTLERLKQSRQKPPTITVGMKLVKEFDGIDYVGKVIQVASDDCEFYRVRYEDSDEEELTLDELQPCITAYSKMQKSQEAKPIVAPPAVVKRKRGRPRKSPIERVAIRKRGRPPKNKSTLERENESSRNTKNSLNRCNSDMQPKRRGRPPKRLKVDEFKNEPVLIENNPNDIQSNVESTDNSAVFSRRSHRQVAFDKSYQNGRKPSSLPIQYSVDWPVDSGQQPKRKRGRPRKYPNKGSETTDAPSSGKGYSSKRFKTHVPEPDILEENIPTPGHVDKSMSYYCTQENDTSAKIAAIIGCESWLDVAYIPENLERFPALQDKKIKFKRGTLVRIAECKFSKKQAAALIE